jgi:hypothetical protein
LAARNAIALPMPRPAPVMNSNGSAHGRAACNEFSQMIDSIKAMRQLSILKHGGQTEREATDFSGLFADTASALAQ